MGALLMVTGLVVIYMATGLFSPDASFGMILFPFTLIILGATLFIGGFSKSPMESKIRGGADKFIKYIRDNWFKAAVGNIVGTKRRWLYVTFFIPMAFTILAFALIINGIIGATFFPNIEPDFFTIEGAYKPGDSKEQTEDFVERATLILIEENERIIEETGDTLLTYYSSNVGASLNIGQSGNHTGMIQVFYNGEGKSTPVDTLMNRIIRRLNSSDEGRLTEDTYVGGFNRFGKEIAIGLTAQREDDLLRAKDELKERMGKIEGVNNIKDNMPPGKNEVELDIRPEAEIYGLSESDVLTQIRGGFFGNESQRVIVETDEIKIWVRFPLEDRNSLFDLQNMKIKTPQGIAIPLKQICDFTMERAPETLKRLDGQRIITVDGECTDPDQVAKINTKIEKTILNEMFKTYPSLKSVEQGQSKRQKKAQGSMGMIVPIGLVIMFIIITLHFNSLSSAFLIMLVIPSGIAGAIIGHGLIGIPVSILSMFGIVALIGVLVNDAIVFLDRYNELLKQGMTVESAAIEAALSRFRPILLTSLTTVAGLLPIIMETSMQAQFLIPVAVSIAFGVLFGTMFILIFYPSAIIFWNRSRIFWRFAIHGERNLEPSSVEPILKLEQNQHEFEN
jgi:multidrug efflux pump subunit AcrB